MFNSLSTRTSQTTPGVSFELRTMTEGMRIDLRLQLAREFSELRALARQSEEIIDAAATRLEKAYEAVLVSDFTRAEAASMAEIQEQARLIEDAKVKPAYLAAMVARVDGLRIDDVFAGAGDLRDGPPALYREILAAVMDAAAGLSEERRKNSGSPSTGGDRVDPATPATDAPPAKPESGTG